MVIREWGLFDCFVEMFFHETFCGTNNISKTCKCLVKDGVCGTRGAMGGMEIWGYCFDVFIFHSTCLELSN